MSDIILFHTAYGLRPAVRRAAERLRGLGHRVETPDLYDGQVADTLEDALVLRDRVGRDQLLRLAQASVASASPGTVLAGFSMGASLAHRVAALDARFSRLLLLHGLFYRGGHLFTDPELPDHYPAAAAEAWARAERFLAG